MGPIDYLVVVEFPGSRMTGKGLPTLVDLVDRGIIRIIDLVFVKKELDGSVTTSTLLGNFALDDGWHQVGHRMRTILWRHGRMVPVGQAPAGALGFD